MCGSIKLGKLLFVDINTDFHDDLQHVSAHVTIYDRMKRLAKHSKPRHCVSWVKVKSADRGSQQT